MLYWQLCYVNCKYLLEIKILITCFKEMCLILQISRKSSTRILQKSERIQTNIRNCTFNLQKSAFYNYNPIGSIVIVFRTRLWPWPNSTTDHTSIPRTQQYRNKQLRQHRNSIGNLFSIETQHNRTKKQDDTSTSLALCELSSVQMSTIPPSTMKRIKNNLWSLKPLPQSSVTK